MDFDTLLTMLDVADKASRLYDWATGAKFGKSADAALDQRRRDDVNILKVSDRVFIDRRGRELITGAASPELIDPRQLRELIDPVAQAIGGTVLTSQIVETPPRLRDAFRSDPWNLLDEIRPAHRQRPNDRPDWVPVAFWEGGVEYIGYQKRGAMRAFGFDFVPEIAPAVADPPRKPSKPTSTIISGPIFNHFPPAVTTGPSRDRLYDDLWATFGPSVPGNHAVIFGNRLTQAKLQQLARHLALPAGEDVFGFVDTTFFQSCACSIVFSETRITFMDPELIPTKAAFYSYRDFAGVEIKNSFWSGVTVGSIQIKPVSMTHSDVAMLLRFLQTRLNSHS